MNKILNALKFAALFTALLTLSCATRLVEPQNSFNLDDKNSIIFGRFVPYLNNALITNRVQWESEGMTIKCYISQYDSSAALKANTPKFPSYSFVADLNKGGYFSFCIPPGKYFIHGYDYNNFFDGHPELSIAVVPSEDSTNTLPVVTFDVPPNRAVYIGTILHNFHTDLNGFLFFSGKLRVNYIDDFENAEEWFLESNQRFKDKVIDGTLNMASLEPVPLPAQGLPEPPKKSGGND